MLRIIQISDTHLFADKDRSLLGVQTQKSLESVVKHIQQKSKKLDFILHSGDITQDYSEESYIHLAETLKPLKAPVYCVPGNHDDKKIMAQVYPREPVSIDKHILSDKWQIILLDSYKENSPSGYLNKHELDYLENSLLENPKHHTLVLLHHHPIFVGSEWLDNLGLINADEFWNIISQFSHMNTVIFGHIHQEFERKVNNINCYGTPSTCFQFKLRGDHFGLENIPQGYRWLNLYDDGRVETAVERIPKYIGHYEETATGY